MKKRLTSALMIVVTLVMLVSCEKEESLKTSGEATAEKINELVEENKIEQCSVYVDGDIAIWWENFEIEDRFLIIANQYYNLDAVQYFEISYSYPSTITFYF